MPNPTHPVRPSVSALDAPERCTLVIIGDLHVNSDADATSWLRSIVDYIIARQYRDRIFAVVNVGDGLITGTTSTVDLYTAEIARLWSAGIFYTEVPGNWNMGESGDSGNVTTRRNTYGLDYIAPASMRAHPAWINNYIETDSDDPTATHPGVKDSIDNSAAIFTLGQFEMMLLWAEFGPTTAAMDWLTRLAERFPHVPKVFLTHSHLGLGLPGVSPDQYPVLTSAVSSLTVAAPPTNEALGATANNGREVWRNWLVGWPNLIGTICGHLHKGDGLQHYIGPDSTGKLTQAITNGDFSNGSTDWALLTPWTVTDGQLSKPSSGSNPVTRSFSELIRGVRYRVRTSITSRTSGAVRYKLGTVYGRWHDSVGQTDEWIECDTPVGSPDGDTDKVGKFLIEPTTDFIGTIDDVLVETEGQEQPNGASVWNIHCNYQSDNSFRQASIRLMEFRPYDSQIVVKTIDPDDEVWSSDAQEEMTIYQPLLGRLVA